MNFNGQVTFGAGEALRRTDVLLLRAGGIGARSQTAMFDVSPPGSHVNQSPLDRKVLVVLSDGDDNRSRMTFNDVLDRSLRSNAVIYTVGIFDPIEGGDRKVLRRLADDTGGLAQFPEQVKEIYDALDRIALDVRHRYTIGYVSTNPSRDRTLRKVSVDAVDRQQRRPLRVNVRTGYIAQ